MTPAQAAKITEILLHHHREDLHEAFMGVLREVEALRAKVKEGADHE